MRETNHSPPSPTRPPPPVANSVTAPAADAGEKTGRMRLARFLAMAGVAARRKAEELIVAGKVCVNGQTVATPAFTVDPAVDRVEFDGRVLTVDRPAVVLLLNKPIGYTCSAADPHAKKLVFELLPTEFGRLFTVGRLDRDSEGLLICTNDGNLAQRLAHPRHGFHKTYHVRVIGEVPGNFATIFRDGMEDDGETLRALSAKGLRRTHNGAELEVVLGEGKKREVRRMCQAMGLHVIGLRRVRLGPLDLGTLPTGAWRRLSAAETAHVLRHGTD